MQSKKGIHQVEFCPHVNAYNRYNTMLVKITNIFLSFPFFFSFLFFHFFFIFFLFFHFFFFSFLSFFFLFFSFIFFFFFSFTFFFLLFLFFQGSRILTHVMYNSAEAITTKLNTPLFLPPDNDLKTAIASNFIVIVHFTEAIYQNFTILARRFNN